MKILHTADWHLGDHLGSVDRTDDQFRSLGRLMAYCEEHKVDVLVVAGDVIEEYHGETLAALIRRLAELLHPQLERGLHALFIPGNHDREHLFGLVETVQALSSPEAVRRLQFVGRPRRVALRDRGGDYSVQFVLAPYPTTHRYLPGEAAARGISGAEKRQLLARAYADKIAAARHELDPRWPAVLVSHVCVRGAETSTLFRMSEAEETVVEPQDLPCWSYVALGHIHKAQEVGGRPYVRYAGSIERLDAGEWNDDKSCVLLEVGPAGLVGQPELLLLPVTPVYAVTVDGSTDLAELERRYPDHERALVSLRIGWQPGIDSPHALVNRLQAFFPRCYRLEVRPLDERDGPALAGPDARDVASTVRAYLERRLAELPDDARARLLTLASDVVEEVQHVAAAR